MMQTYFKIALLGTLFCAGAVGAAVSDYIYEDMGERMERKEARQRVEMVQKKLHDEAGIIMDRFGDQIESIKKVGGSVEDYLKAVNQALEKLTLLFNVDMYKSSVWQLYKMLNINAQDNDLLSSHVDTILKPLQEVGSFKGPLKFEKIFSLTSKLESKYKNDVQVGFFINEFKNVIQGNAPYNERLKLAQNMIEKTKLQLGDLEKFMYFVNEIRSLLRALKKEANKPEFTNQLVKPLTDSLEKIGNDVVAAIEVEGMKTVVDDKFKNITNLLK